MQDKVGRSPRLAFETRIELTAERPVMFAPRFARPVLSCLALLGAALGTARAEIVYDNSDTGGTNVWYAPATVVEYGDEVILGSGSRIMSEFVFEYYGNFAPAGDENARLRVYVADGPKSATGHSTPGTVLYDSGTFSLSPGWQIKRFSGLNVTVPTTLIWTIEFGGLSGLTGDQAGLVFREKPSVGRSFDDIWQRTNNSWQLFRWNGDPIANFAARILAGVEGTTVAIRRDTNRIIVEWTGLSVLQVADHVSGPFTDVPNVRNRYEISATAASSKFWRLKD